MRVTPPEGRTTYSDEELDSAVVGTLCLLQAYDVGSSVSVYKVFKYLSGSRIGTTHARISTRLESLKSDGYVVKDRRGFFYLTQKGKGKCEEAMQALRRLGRGRIKR